MIDSGSATDRFRLDDKLALVTGAGKGIGRACAVALASAGAKVIAVARTESDLSSLAADFPGSIEAWCCDVTDDAFLDRVLELEKLDVLVNNVGTNKPQPFVDVERSALDTMLTLNLRSVFLVAQAAAIVMNRQGSGSIIHMGSQMGHVGAANRSVYCMTKHGVEGLTKATAVELAPRGIRVNSVAPTFIETPMTRPMLDDPEFARDVLAKIPMGKLGHVDDVANAVLFLASDASAMITGSSVRVDGGWTAL